MKNLCVIIHTCDDYEFCWEGWYRSYQKNWDMNLNVDMFFVNEEKQISYENLIQLKTGKGEWSDRLLFALNRLEYENVLYIQEDVWILKKIDITKYYEDFLFMNMDALRFLNSVTGSSRHYSFEKGIYSENYLKFSKDSDYLISHQPSIWKKKFLIKCLNTGENPWINEIDGTERIRNSDKHPNIYSVRDLGEWYLHAARHGRLTESALQKLIEYRL